MVLGSTSYDGLAGPSLDMLQGLGAEYVADFHPNLMPDITELATSWMTNAMPDISGLIASLPGPSLDMLQGLGAEYVADFHPNLMPDITELAPPERSIPPQLAAEGLMYLARLGVWGLLVIMLVSGAWLQYSWCVAVGLLLGLIPLQPKEPWRLS